MDDIYDLRSIFLGEDAPVRELVVSALEGTPLEESAERLLHHADRSSERQPYAQSTEWRID